MRTRPHPAGFSGVARGSPLVLQPNSLQGQQARQSELLCYHQMTCQCLRYVPAPQNAAEQFKLNHAANHLTRLLACAGHTSPYDCDRSCTRASREDATAHTCCGFSSKAAVTNEKSGRHLPAGCQQCRPSDTRCTTCKYSDPCCSSERTQPAAVQQPCATGHPDQRVTNDTVNLSALATGHKSSPSPDSNRHVKPCCSGSHCCTA
jgi:hypothetical protein